MLITEKQLKRIIREAIETVLNSNGGMSDTKKRVNEIINALRKTWHAITRLLRDLNQINTESNEGYTKKMLLKDWMDELNTYIQNWDKNLFDCGKVYRGIADNCPDKLAEFMEGNYETCLSLIETVMDGIGNIGPGQAAKYLQEVRDILSDFLNSYFTV